MTLVVRILALALLLFVTQNPVLAQAPVDERRYVFILSDRAGDEQTRTQASHWVHALRLRRHSILATSPKLTEAITIDWNEVPDPSAKVKEQFDFSHGKSLFAVAVLFSTVPSSDPQKRVLQFDNRVYLGDKSGSLQSKYLEFIQRMDVLEYDGNRDAVASILLYTHAIDLSNRRNVQLVDICDLLQRARLYTGNLADRTKVGLLPLSSAIQVELLNRNCGPRP